MDKNRFGFAMLLAAATCLAAPAGAVEGVGTMPVPTLTNVKAAATATYDGATKLYTYTYAVSNGSASTGSILDINIDMASKFGGSYGNQLKIDVGGGDTVTFAQALKDAEPLLLPPGEYLVPFGASCPVGSGWSVMLSRDGYAGFGASNKTNLVAPGAKVSPLKLISPGPPVIREMIVEPDWVAVVNGDAGKTVAAKAGKVEHAIRVHLQTLAPAGVPKLSWSALDAQVAQAIKLGWIPDATLAQEIQNGLDAANTSAVQQHDGTAAKKKLTALLKTLAGASSDQIHTEARDLIKLNAEALIRVIPDTPIPVTPKYSLTPAESAHTAGAAATLIARVVNSSDHDKPLEGYAVRFEIVEGPDSGHVFPWNLRTNANGQVKVSYKGQGIGTDKVLLRRQLPSAATAGSSRSAVTTETGLPPGAVAEALVHWQGGADLAVPLFIPPLVKTKGGNPIDLTDWTQNLGDTPAGPSVTRYYLSKTKPVDPHTATVLAERQVPALKPGEQSRGQPIHTTLPAGLKPGVYHLVACADADHQVIETNEHNNCFGSHLKNIVTMVVTADRPPNLPPDCSKAQPGEPLLWPPNHKLHAVTIQNVTDPDGDKVTLTVTGIAQDEPVNGKGDGNTAPDGFGVGSTQAKVRAERSGKGQGRLYFVHFRAADGKGGTCTGSVTVGVPHDRSAKGLPQDTGERYDSTQAQ